MNTNGGAFPMVEIWRGDRVESRHSGHAVIANSAGEIVDAWGDAEKVILPRSSLKMIQALPLVESGTARSLGLSNRHLALACASHNAAAAHTDLVRTWLADLGFGPDDLVCGAQPPADDLARSALIRSGLMPDRVHNNCSGKHSAFLSLVRHMKYGPDYADPDHPIQATIRSVLADLSDDLPMGHAIDGCSAPNYALTLCGFARALARFGSGLHGVRAEAAQELFGAMVEHPDLVAGEGRACTELMRAMGGHVAIKTGAEGVFSAILPARGIGIAVKIEDGATRAAEAAMTALLVREKALSADHTAARRRLGAPIRNWDGLVTGRIDAAPGFPD
ncbi:MAG: asparaginase [Pseudomonadota bacterium]